MSKDKYSFQDNAIKNIVSDFKEKNDSRLLLVIPTGGGKTLTAIRSIDQMINENLVNEKNKCLWITHRKALKKQTEDVVSNKKWIKKFNFNTNLGSLLDIQMIASGQKIISNDRDKDYKYIIIDECHHSKASSYKQFFIREDLGVLGLTATPTRLDKKELDFDKITYQITFKKLIRKGVIIKPNIIPFNTDQTINASNINIDSNESEKFNTDKRNNVIVDSIYSNKKKFSKVIIYVNTIKHSKDLYSLFSDRIYEQKNSKNEDFYDFIGYIAGGNDNPDNIDNNDYLDKFKNAKNAIIINTQILTEGFDDPSINTIAMAVPTGSIVRFIQCIGRAIRNPDVESNALQQAPSIIEFTDNLPDVGYRITSGWLFADISDELQPEIQTIHFRDYDDLKLKISNISEYHSLNDINVDSIQIESDEDYDYLNLFIFTAFEEYKSRKNPWKGLLLDKNSKEDFVYAYNNVNNAILNKLTITQAFDHKFPSIKELDFLNNPGKQQNMWYAMEFAYNEIRQRRRGDRLKYFIFDKIEYPYEIEEFLKNCFNKESILSEYSRKIEEKLSTHILKFPSKIINEYEAYYANEEQLSFCKKFIEQLNEKILIHEPYEVNLLIESLLQEHDSIQIPIRFIDGLCLINKENLKYFIKM